MFLKSIKKSVYDIADSILKIIYPDKCIVCHKIISKSFDFGICEECIKDFCVFSEESCKKNFINDNGFSMFLYNDPIKKSFINLNIRIADIMRKLWG